MPESSVTDTVDEALGLLEGLDDRPVTEHVEVFDTVHRTLQDTLATLDGRALARIAAVTLDSNTITVPNTGTTSVMLLSAAVVTGPYTDAKGQSVNLATRTITVPKSDSMLFYRIRAGAALTITSITVSGGNVVITYQ